MASLFDLCSLLAILSLLIIPSIFNNLITPHKKLLNCVNYQIAKDDLASWLTLPVGRLIYLIILFFSIFFVSQTLFCLTSQRLKTFVFYGDLYKNNSKKSNNLATVAPQTMLTIIKTYSNGTQ